MAILGVPSTSIVDSTSVGRSLITASDAAAARVIMDLAAVDDVTFNSVSAVDGNFSGVVTSDANLTLQSNAANAKISLANSGSVTITALNTIYQQFLTGGVSYRKDCYPTFNGSTNLGLDTNRWGSTYSVDGSFTGTLDTEVGGSNRLFNLGSDADVAAGDTEYLETSFDTNVATIASVATGTGVQRNIEIDAPDVSFSGTVTTGAIDHPTNTELKTNGSSKMSVTAGYVRAWVDFRPTYDGTVELGKTDYRWEKTWSVDADFSGDVIMAANVDFTGVPTTDPEVAGRLWNDSGSVKISAGSPPP